MSTKHLATILLVLIALVAVFFYVRQRSDTGVNPLPEEHQSTFSWRFATTESEDGLPPRTTVSLITGADVYNLGGFAGTCAEISAENLLENEVAGVLCWWAGGGDELGVFFESGRYIIKHGYQEESTAEGEGLRGDFVEMAVIE